MRSSPAWRSRLPTQSPIAREVGRDVDEQRIRGSARSPVQRLAPDVRAISLGPAYASDLANRAAIGDLAAALTVRVEGQRRRKTSREVLQKLVKRGIAAIDVLDAVVKPRLETRPDVLAAWNSVRRPIEPGGGVSTAAGEPDITPAKVA